MAPHESVVLARAAQTVHLLRFGLLGAHLARVLLHGIVGALVESLAHWAGAEETSPEGGKSPFSFVALYGRVGPGSHHHHSQHHHHQRHRGHSYANPACHLITSERVCERSRGKVSHALLLLLLLRVADVSRQEEGL